MDKIRSFLQSKWLIMIVVIVGLGMRFLAATRGYNHDFDSYTVVADIVSRGGNVYASTTQYNYGPIWFYILHVLDLLASGVHAVFRYLLVTLLSLVDVGIFAFMLRRLGKLAAFLFFLNPISIIITGYHNQFDNLAILLGMLAVTLIGDDFDRPISGRKALGLLTLGLSLATKHILFLFPIWLAVKQKNFLQKAAVVLIPVSIFILGFIPYWNEGKQGILNNVLYYSNQKNEFFYKLFVPDIIRNLLTSVTVWIIILLFFAFFFRQKNGFDSLLFYTAVLVGASPLFANQYLAIPVAFVSANLNLFTILYTVVGTWFLLVDANGLHSFTLQHLINLARRDYYPILIYLLCFGFVWRIWSRQISAFLIRVFLEIKIQFGNEARG